MLQALIDKRIGRRDQAQAWVWRLAGYTRELHEEYAVQRWPETKRLLGLLVNSSGRAHGRNARRLVHAARKQDRRLAVALLAAAVSHTPEGEEVLRGARMRMARKPSAVARELLRNFPKGGKRRRKRKRGGNGNGEGENGENGNAPEAEQIGAVDAELSEVEGSSNGGAPEQKPKRRRRKSKAAKEAGRNDDEVSVDGGGDSGGAEVAGPEDAEAKPKPKRKPAKRKATKDKDAASDDAEAEEKPKAKAKPKRKPKSKAAKKDAADGDSEAGQMHIAGTEGDAVAVGESDD
jgi:ribonuclease E